MNVGTRRLTGGDLGPSNLAWITGMGLLVCFFAVDLFAYGTNFSIAYPLVLLFFAAGRRASLTPLTALLIFITYVGYFGKFHIIFHEPFGPATPHRLFNRTMVAFSIAATGAMLNHWYRRNENEFGEEAHDTGFPADDLELSINQMTTALMCGALVIVICLFDVFAPRSYNFAILYSIPVLLAARSGSRFLVWILVPMLLLFTALGGGLGFSAGASASVILWNRFIASLTILGVAASTKSWTSSHRSIHSTQF